MNYLETLKNIAKNKERRTQNLILLVVMLVIILISINYIFSDKSNSTSTKQNIINSKNTNEDASQEDQNTNANLNTSLEKKLSDVLSQISGISEVSVVLSYSKDTTQNVVYNTKETQESGKTSSEKTVAYNEDGTKKQAIVETVEMPKVEGAIVVAKGANTVDVKSKIATAVATITSIPVYKVQVFEKES